MDRVTLYSSASADSMPSYELFRACTRWLPAVCAASESGNCLSNTQAHRRQCVLCCQVALHCQHNQPSEQAQHARCASLTHILRPTKHTNQQILHARHGNSTLCSLQHTRTSQSTTARSQPETSETFFQQGWLAFCTLLQFYAPRKRTVSSSTPSALRITKLCGDD